MQYCDMGTLEQAVRRGDFHNPLSGQPKLVRQQQAACLQVRPTATEAQQQLAAAAIYRGFW